MLKTHVDLLDEFDDDFVKQLQALADKHGALLLHNWTFRRYSAVQHNAMLRCSELCV